MAPNALLNIGLGRSVGLTDLVNWFTSQFFPLTATAMQGHQWKWEKWEKEAWWYLIHPG